jgi:hypothetical protein
MAISTNAKGIAFDVLVDGQPLQEYDCNEPDGTQTNVPETERICKYVEAVPDANFEIRLTIEPRYSLGDGMSGIVHSIVVDGVSCLQHTVLQQSWAKKLSWKYKGHIQDKATYREERPFRFETLQTSQSFLEAYDQKLNL